MKNKSSIIWGLVLIAVGVILGGNALNLFDINIFFKGWWTLFIIIPCFVGLFTEKSKTGNIIGLLVGVALLLACLGVINFDILWKLLVPTIIIIIGLSLLFKNVFDRELSAKIKELNEGANSDGEVAAVFSGQKVNADGEEFKGKKLSAVFGGVEYDLTGAKIKEDAVINASAIFGGIDILVPNGVNVKVKSSSLFGGVTDKTRRKKDDKNEKAPTIYVNASCLFGGVEIK